MTSYPAPNPPYVGPAAHTSGSGNKPINRIVLHSTVSPCEPGGARNIATYFRSQSAGGSAHYVVDPDEVVQVVWDDTIAWHAPPNSHSLGIEMCDYPTNANANRWNDANHKAMLVRTARLVAELCLAYDVPPWFRTPVGLRLGRRGVTTHNNVSQAFGQSSHWDPGAWPRLHFMRMVRREIKRIKKGGDGPKPQPEPDPVPTPRTAELAVGTANLGPKSSRLDPLAAFDVFGLCEAGDRGKDIATFRAEHPDFATITDNGPGRASTPILYKPAVLRLVSVDYVPVDKAPKGSRVVPVGTKKNGAGPAVLKPKWVVHAEFKHVGTGQTVHLLHGHFLPSWTRTAKSLGAGEWKMRRAFGSKHVAALVKTIDECDGLVFVTGDINAPPHFQLLKPLNRVTKVDNTQPTHPARHPNRLIDQIRHRPNPAVAVVSERRIDIGSDHMAAGVAYRITA